MKKKLVKFLVCFCLAAVAMGGCGNDSETTSGRVAATAMETEAEEPEVEEEAEEPEVVAEQALEYVEPETADFEYKYDEELGGVIITGYNGEAEAIRIPAEIDGEPVVSIGKSAFRSCNSLTGIIIPDSVTSIGETAFLSCSSLMEITIPDSVTSIGKSAFMGCSSLTGIIIPDSVTSIENSTFESCSSLTKITIPDSVTSIGWHAFGSCSSLRNLTIPDNAEIASDAFFVCGGLTVSYQGREYTYTNDPNDWWGGY